MDGVSDWRSSLKTLSMMEISSTLPANTFSRAEKRSRAKMEEAISQLPENFHTQLAEAALSKRRKIESVADENLQKPVPVEETIPQSEDTFFHTVSDECIDGCVSSFINATGNVATTIKTCAVCAGNFFAKELTVFAAADMPGKTKLRPEKTHPAHVLTEGMLLHHTVHTSTHDSGKKDHILICHTCLSYLNRDKTPPLALANNMWIGDIPPQLSILTLPERILIACFFPAAYIVKLYPKKTGAHSWSSDGMHSALCGNVSTYRLNTDDVHKITAAPVLPHCLAVLASTVGVTFIGPKNVPEKTMPGFLRVNRERVHVALNWLKEHNPVYKNITISAERLHELPNNQVPFEIMSVVKYSEDTAALAQENDNYVPDDDQFHSGEWVCAHPFEQF